MIEGCEHGPEYQTGTPCPKCEKEKIEQEALTKKLDKKILPSIKELEDILEREGTASIEMLPNGEIRAVEK